MDNSTQTAHSYNMPEVLTWTRTHGASRLPGPATSPAPLVHMSIFLESRFQSKVEKLGTSAKVSYRCDFVITRLQQAPQVDSW